jgi:hypothetical protein
MTVHHRFKQLPYADGRKPLAVVQRIQQRVQARHMDPLDPGRGQVDMKVRAGV